MNSLDFEIRTLKIYLNLHNITQVLKITKKISQIKKNKNKHEELFHFTNKSKGI